MKRFKIKFSNTWKHQIIKWFPNAFSICYLFDFGWWTMTRHSGIYLVLFGISIEIRIYKDERRINNI